MEARFIGELPERRSARSRRVRGIVVDLMDRPGEWAEIRTYSGDKRNAGYVYAHNCRTGKNRSLSPAMGFEVEARSPTDGVVSIYARYIGRQS